MHRIWTIRARGVLAAGLLAPLMGACIPYAVGTTAEPVAPRERVRTLAMTVMPPVHPFGSTRGQSFLSMDGEIRLGIDSTSDFGLRLVGGSGFVGSYKRLVTRRDEPAMIALMPAVGIVNLGDHAYFDLTLVVSPRSRRPGSAAPPSRFVPYGGWRVMQVLPLTSSAVHDQPTIGGFVGLRIGTETLGVSPEIGVFHDPSALGVRPNPIIVVPSISVHGDQLIDLITSIPRPRRTFAR